MSDPAEEAIRRSKQRFARARYPLPTPPGNILAPAGAVVGGYLPCTGPACGRLVRVKDDPGGKCPEHRPPPKRSYMTPNYRVIDLDEQLAEAERQYAKAQEALSAAEAQLRRVRTEVEAYDRRHGGG